MLFGVLAGCAGDNGAKASADSAAAAAAAVPATPVVYTVTAKDFSFDAPDTITGGMVTIKLVNQGPDLHHIQLIKLSDGNHQIAFFAFADFDDFAFLAAFKHVFQSRQPEAGLGTFCTVATSAGGFEKRLNVLVERDVFLFGCRRQLAQVNCRGSVGRQRECCDRSDAQRG